MHHIEFRDLKMGTYMYVKFIFIWIFFFTFWSARARAKIWIWEKEEHSQESNVFSVGAAARQIWCIFSKNDNLQIFSFFFSEVYDGDTF